MQMPFYKILLFCLIASSHSFANIDSLTNLLSVYRNDTSRVRVLNTLADKIQSSDGEQALAYAIEARELAQSLDDQRGEGESFYQLAYIYHSLGKYELSLEAAQNAVNIAHSLGAVKKEASSYYILGAIRVHNGDNTEGMQAYKRCYELSDSINYQRGIRNAAKGMGDVTFLQARHVEAEQHFNTQLRISMETYDQRGISISYLDLARVMKAKGNFAAAVEYYLKGIKIAKSINDIRLQAIIVHNLGIIYFNMGDYRNALHYHEQCISLSDSISYSAGLAGGYQEVGRIKYKQEEYDEAISLFETSLKIRQTANDVRGESYSYENLAKAYAKKKDFETAMDYHQKSLSIREELRYLGDMARSNLEIGKLMMEANRNNTALPLLINALTLMEEVEDLELLSQIQLSLSQCYETSKDYKDALKAKNDYIQLRDSIMSRESRQQVSELRLLYETEIKEKILLAQEISILQLEKDHTKITSQRNYLMGGSLTLGLLGLFGFQWYKVRKERNDKKEFAEALLITQEEERKRLARDLHDGIGQSLLLVKKQLEKNTAITLDNQNLITDTIEEVRSISQDLHPYQIEKFGITAAIEEILFKVEKSTGLFITSEIEDINNLLSDTAEINIYRIIQEAMSNIVKHAKATAAKVELKNTTKNIQISIQDNGEGFNHDMVIAQSKSLGLKTMYERISTIGGKLRFSNNQGGGTHVNIIIPIN